MGVARKVSSTTSGDPVSYTWTYSQIPKPGPRVIVRHLLRPTSWNHYEVQMKIQNVQDAEGVVIVSTYMANDMLVGIFLSK